MLIPNSLGAPVYCDPGTGGNKETSDEEGQLGVDFTWYIMQIFVVEGLTHFRTSGQLVLQILFPKE